MPPKPLDTSQLGPIRIEPNSEAARAKIVRDALLETCKDFELVDTACAMAALTLAQAYSGANPILAKLGRMLK